MPHLGNLLSLSLYQPLYSGGEITAGIQKTRYQTQMASTDLKIVTDNIKMEVLDCYLSLLKNRNLLSVYDENIKQTKQLIEEMKVRSEQGWHWQRRYALRTDPVEPYLRQKHRGQRRGAS